MQKPGAVLLVALATFLLAAASASAAGPTPRIVNGTETENDGEFPWTVALVGVPVAGQEQAGDKEAFCGGTLIAPSIVLTAAHCTIARSPSDLEVVVGDHDLGDDATPASPGVDADHLFQVQKISLHPDADPDYLGGIPRYDLSLITLTDDTGAVPTAEPLPLAASGTTFPDGTALHVSGWGATGENEGVVDVMHYAEVQKKSDTTCETRFLGAFFSTDQICAIGDEALPTVRDTCQGDSGGPLAHHASPSIPPTSATDWTLIGTTSWGEGCARAENGAGLPAAYARVTAPQLHAYASQATDDSDSAGEQPFLESGEPLIVIDPSLDGGGISCNLGTTDWSASSPPDLFDFLVRRADGEVVSTTGFYDFDEGDAGDRFFCEVRARKGGVGGYGIALSATRRADPATPDSPVLVPTPVPGPTVQVPVPGPPVPVPFPIVEPRPDDEVDPRIESVRRSCTRRRICTFRIEASDEGEGVKTIAATINTVRTRSCRRGGRRTTCASWRATPVRARPVAGEEDLFRITTRRLTRGTHVLLARAVDAAGNVQERPRRVSFRVR